jgi:hypothetical protein
VSVTPENNPNQGRIRQVGLNFKFQAPSSRENPIPKLQKDRRAELELEACSFSGAWMPARATAELELGAFYLVCRGGGTGRVSPEEFPCA